MVHGISLYYFLQVHVKLPLFQNKKFHLKSCTVQNSMEATLGHQEKAILL